MSRRLMADGVTGKVAIMQQGSRDAFKNPKDNLSKIHFHSDLDYMGIVQQLFIANVAFPARQGSIETVKVSSKGGGFFGKGTKKKKYYYPRPQSGIAYYYLGDIVGDLDGPMLGFRDGAIPLTSIPIYQNTYNSKGSNYQAWRSVSLGLDGSRIMMKETWYSMGADLPAQSVNDIRIVKFNMMTGANLPDNRTLYITPDVFIASKGKLDSRNRYVKRSATGPYWVYYGRTMNSDNGGCRWVYPVISNGKVQNVYLEEGGYSSTSAFYANLPTGIAV